MTQIASAIVHQRARLVISRYLHQREPAVSSVGSRTTPSSTQLSDASTQSTGVSASSARVRFPSLPDDYDVLSLNVFDLLDYLSELSFSRELKLTTARCYRRWLAAYLEDAGHPDAVRVRSWVIPHSPDYYEMLLMAADDLESEKQAAATIEESKAQESQLDMFASPLYEALAPQIVWVTTHNRMHLRPSLVMRFCR